MQVQTSNNMLKHPNLSFKQQKIHYHSWLQLCPFMFFVDFELVIQQFSKITQQRKKNIVYNIRITNIYTKVLKV